MKLLSEFMNGPRKALVLDGLNGTFIVQLFENDKLVQQSTGLSEDSAEAYAENFVLTDAKTVFLSEDLYSGR